MPKEYEAKFLNIDVDTIKKILRKNKILGFGRYVENRAPGPAPHTPYFK